METNGTVAGPSLLDELIVGKNQGPPRILIHGPEKIGKSTWAASAPKPVFIQTEDGLGNLGPARFPLAKNLDAVVSFLHRVRSAHHSFDTLAIDSMDWLEHLIWDEVNGESKTKSIEKAAGGYGKGYVRAAEIFRSLLLDFLDPIRIERGMAIILISHTRVEKVDEPGFPTYGRYVPDIHRHAVSTIKEWVDVIGFAHKKIRVEKVSDDRHIVHPLGADGGERVLRLVESPAYLAGNRFNITKDVALSWDAFAAALSASN